MKLKHDPYVSIPVGDLKDGQIAIITDWGETNNHIGKIIQRYNDILIVLGKPYGESFPNTLNSPYNKDLFVRVLEPGTLLEI